MLSRIAVTASALLLIAAVFVALRAAAAPQKFGIDFVQFWLTGRYVSTETTSSVYSDEERELISDAASRQVEMENHASRLRSDARLLC